MAGEQRRPPRRRRRRAGLAAAALVLGTAGVLALHPTLASSPAQGSGRRTVDVVALGDSVLVGSHCRCDPFPVRYGRLLAARTGTVVHVDDAGRDGLDTGGLLDQLGHRATGAEVARADVVLVTIGANDFTDHHDDVTGGTCVTADSDCTADELAGVRSGVRRVVARVGALRGGAPTTVLVTGYWNVFEDGDVARTAYGATGLRASLALTRRANAAIAAAARAGGATYVDLYRPFQSRGAAITGLLAADGDHPSAAGHALIARTLLAAGLPTG